MTNIEWTQKTWNPIVGCDIVSTGCTNCYAMKFAARQERMNPNLEHYQGLTKPSKSGPVWTGKIGIAPDHILFAPLRRQKPTTYFVNSMSDLFHDGVPHDVIDRVYAVMALSPQHTFKVLTKRPERMYDYLTTCPAKMRQFAWAKEAKKLIGYGDNNFELVKSLPFPLQNVWLGVSVERQKEADERILDLLVTPAAVRFVSAEPLLGPIDFTNIKLKSRIGSCDRLNAINGNLDQSDGSDFGQTNNLDLVIVGGESGPDARPMHADWVRSIRDQCAASIPPVDSFVAFFFKQWGSCIPLETDEEWGKYNIGACHHSLEHDFNYARVGKTKAGRLLDGRLHDAMPEIQKATS